MATRETATGGKAATAAVVPGLAALSIGRPTTLAEPKGFRWTELGSVARLESGHTPSRSRPDYWDGDIPWIGIRDATANHGGLLLDTEQHVTQLGIDNSSARVLPTDTVCLSRTASVGYVVQIKRPMATSQDFVNWVCGPEISPTFLRYLLVSESESVRRFAHGSVHATMYYPDAKALHVLLPSRPEQQAIAEVLGALDEKISVNATVASTAEHLLRTEVDASWLHESSREAVLSDYLDLNPANPKPKDTEPLYVDMKKLPESGWSIGTPERREAKGGARFQRGDTLLARITPCLENRKTGFVDNIEAGETAIGSTEFIVLRARAGMAPPIGFLLATEARFREYAIQNMVGTSGRQRVAAADLARFELPKPKEGWLADFGARAIAVFDQIEALHKENLTLTVTRDALLPQLISGKVRVRDAEAAASAAGA